MKTSRGYAPPAGENSLRGVRYSFDRFSFMSLNFTALFLAQYPVSVKFKRNER